MPQTDVPPTNPEPVTPPTLDRDTASRDTPRRRRRRWIMTIAVLAFLMLLFDFDPFHPIHSWERLKDNFHQGWEAAGRDIAKKAARDSLAKLHALHSGATPSSSTTSR